ncbi:MAG: hypothetical protein LBS99_05460 [Clostridiales bacterium]|jgi:hypothetical protein|nr:hypothetical protein [Clostridiales bacterium]
MSDYDRNNYDGSGEPRYIVDDGNDGYAQDDYYDDRLGEVLNELADLRELVMAPGTQGSNDVVLNEIARLREENLRIQQSSELNAQIAKLKEELGARSPNPYAGGETVGSPELTARIDALYAEFTALKDEFEKSNVCNPVDIMIEILEIKNILLGREPATETKLVAQMPEEVAGNILSELNKIREGVESQNTLSSTDVLSELAAIRQRIDTNVAESDNVEIQRETDTEILNEIYRLRDDVGAGTDYDLLAELFAFKEEMRSSHAESEATIKSEINGLREDVRNIISLADDYTEESAYAAPSETNGEAAEANGEAVETPEADENKKEPKGGVSLAFFREISAFNAELMDEVRLVRAEVAALREEIGFLKGGAAAYASPAYAEPVAFDTSVIDETLDDLRTEILMQKSDTDNHIIIENSMLRDQIFMLNKRASEIEDKDSLEFAKVNSELLTLKDDLERADRDTAAARDGYTPGVPAQEAAAATTAPVKKKTK